MYLKSVGIHYSCMTTHRNNVKTGFAFYNEVLHQTSLTIKFNEVFRRWVYICDDKCIPIIYLISRFLSFEDNTSFTRPCDCLIHEFAINYSTINFVFSDDIIKLINQIFIHDGLKKINNTSTWILGSVS